MYKRTFVLFYLAVLSVLNGCDKLNELITFNIYNETEITIPSQSGISLPLIIRSPEIKTSSEQSFKNNNTKAELVETAHLSELQLSIVAPEKQNFNFLNEITIYIKDANGNEEPVAFRKNIPEDGSTVIKLETTGTNLKPYIQQENYSIRTDVKTDQIVNHEVKIKINMTFRVKAKVF